MRSAWASRDHCTDGWGGAQHNFWSTPSAIQCWNPHLNLLNDEEGVEVARLLNIFSSVMPLSASPSSITTASLHNCCLPPQCTMSKHVVLGGGGREEGMSAAQSVGIAGAGLAEATQGQAGSVWVLCD